MAIPSLKRLAEEPLRPDLSNIERISYAVAGAELLGARSSVVREALISKMVEIGNAGHGVNPDRLPPPLSQSGPNCQTFALLNGIQAVAGSAALGNLPSEVEDLRRRSRQFETAVTHAPRGFEADNDGLSMSAIAEVLVGDGVLVRKNTRGYGPLATVKELFSPDMFLGYANNSQMFHAVAVVGLAKPTRDRFAVSINSLGGRQHFMSADNVLDMLMSTNILLDHQMLFQAARPAPVIGEPLANAAMPKTMTLRVHGPGQTRFDAEFAAEDSLDATAGDLIAELERDAFPPAPGDKRPMNAWSVSPDGRRALLSPDDLLINLIAANAHVEVSRFPE